MFANSVLAVFIEGRRKPNDRAIRKRTETSVEMVEPWIDKFDRDDKTAEHFRDRAMRFDVGAKFVTAKERIAAEKRVTFAFEVVVLRQPRDLIAAFFHPTGEMWPFARAFRVPKIARDESFADNETCVRGKDHVRKSGLGRDKIDFALEVGQGCMQTAPLLLRARRFRAAGATHPRIDLVFNAIVIRRTKQQLPHKIDNYLSRS